jgi:hypothetical protein
VAESFVAAALAIIGLTVTAMGMMMITFAAQS